MSWLKSTTKQCERETVSLGSWLEDKVPHSEESQVAGLQAAGYIVSIIIKQRTMNAQAHSLLRNGAQGMFYHVWDESSHLN